MTLTQLAAANPGERLGSIRHGGGQLIETTIAEGVLSEPDDDLDVLLALDSMGNPEVAVGVEHVEDGPAEIGIEVLDGGSTDPVFMQRLVVEAMARSGVKCGSLDPKVATIPKEILPQVGFHANASGDTYTLSMAA